MKSGKLVSIITPFHNTDIDLFRETVKSVREQSLVCDFYEWIVIFHNCEKNYVEDALEELDKSGVPYRSLFLNDSFSTPSSPRNFGIDNANGKYLYFLDSDDMVGSDFLEAALKEMEESGSDLVVAGAKSLVKKNNVFPLPMPLLFYSDSGIFSINNSDRMNNREMLGRLLYGAPVFLSTKLIKKELIDRAGLRFDTASRVIEDIQFEAVLYSSAAHISVLTDKVAYTYVQREGSQLQSCMKNGGADVDVILHPVSVVVSECIRGNIDPNLFLWSIFEMLGAMVLSNSVSTDYIAKLESAMEPFSKMLKLPGYTGPAGVRKVEATMEMAALFLRHGSKQLDTAADNLTELIGKIKSFDGTAIVTDEGECTFAELNSNSDSVAKALNKRVALSKTPVCLCIADRMLSFYALFGVIKTGNPVLVYSADTPVERIRFGVEDSGAKCIICDEPVRKLLSGFDIPLLSCGELLSEENNCPLPICSAPEKSDNPFLFIYTSGSEGKPKGVMLTRGNVLSLLYPFSDNTNVTVPRMLSNIYLMHSGIDFILGFLTLLEGLLGGKTVYSLRNPAQIESDFVRNMLGDKDSKVALAAVPSTAALWFSDPKLKGLFRQVTVIKFAGESLNSEQVADARKCIADNASILSVYGSTETGPCAAGILTEFRVCCGFPLSDVAITILDGNMNCVPNGKPGRICISGCRVSPGYVGNESESFIKGRNGINHFLTGDEGLINDKGELVITGRIDRMLKIHGMRVDPSEIEKALCSHPEVTGAVVIRNKAGEKKRIVGFYTSSVEIEESALRDFLAEKIPYYMIPDLLVRKESFPLNERGKLDYKSLTVPDNQLSEEIDGNCSEAVLNVFREVLNDSSVDSSTNFFASGGDSIKALYIAAGLKTLGFDIALRDVFIYPSPALLMKHVEKKDSDRGKSKSFSKDFIANYTVKEYFDMPQAYREAFRYAVRIQFTTTKCVDPAYLKKRCDAIMRKHPSLRTLYFRKENSAVSVLYGEVKPEGESDIYYADISSLSPDSIEDLICSAWTEMDRNDKPFSVTSFKTENGKYEVLVRICHVYSDAIGCNIILRELMDSAEINSDNEDGFLAAQADRIEKREESDTAYAYFAEYLKDAVPACIPRVDDQSASTEVVRRKVVLNSQEFAKLKEYCRNNGLVFDIFIQYLYGRALIKAFGKSDLIFLCLFSGRNTVNSDAVGNFFSILPVCIREKMTAFDFQNHILKLKDFYYLDIDDISRKMRTPFRLLGCIDGINSNLFEPALTGSDILDSKQVFGEEIKGNRMFRDGEGLVIEIDHFANQNAGGIYSSIESELRYLISSLTESGVRK